MLDYSLQSVTTDLKTLSVDDFLTKRLFDAVPFVFRKEYEKYITWRKIISQELQIDSYDIVFSGSAAFGYSFSPYKNFKPFDADSDVDICIISDYFFDIAWHEIRHLNMYEIPLQMHSTIKEHRERLIFWETIATDKILPLLSFGSKWNQVMNKKRGFIELEDHEINFRIYRSSCSIRNYQRLSISNRRNQVLGQEE